MLNSPTKVPKVEFYTPKRRDFDANHAYDLMVKRIREEVLEEAAQMLEEGAHPYDLMHAVGAAKLVRGLK